MCGKGMKETCGKIFMFSKIDVLHLITAMIHAVNLLKGVIHLTIASALLSGSKY